MEQDIWQAVKAFPWNQDIVTVYPATDDRDDPTIPFLAVFYAARSSSDLREKLERQTQGHFEEWQKHQVRYFPQKPDREAELVVQQHPTRQDLARQAAEAATPHGPDHQSPHGQTVSSQVNRARLDTTREAMRKIKDIINANADKWFADHSNLTVIKPDLLKSSGYDPGVNELKVSTSNTPCIVFLCHKKHIIPLTEPWLPTEVDGIPTDVREGMFYPLNNSPDSQ